MLFFNKSHPGPECLENQKCISGDYKCGDVVARLETDFHNKCYLCEIKYPTNINVEHFIPHKGDIDLKFSWNNLFFSCVHCNKIKGTKENLLDCTIDEEIEHKLKYGFSSFSENEITIEAMENEERIVNTQNLLSSIFYGSTKLAKLESSNLRKKLVDDLNQFWNKINNYIDSTEENIKHLIFLDIQEELSKNSSFTSFKRWIIRSDNELFDEFGEYI
jgi:HNH endonuclease